MTLKISNNRLNKYSARQQLATAIDTSSYFTVHMPNLSGTQALTAGTKKYVCTLPKDATFVEAHMYFSAEMGDHMVSTLTAGTNVDMSTGYTAISAATTFDDPAAAAGVYTITGTGTASAGDNIVLDVATSPTNNTFVAGSFTFKLVDDPTQ